MGAAPPGPSTGFQRTLQPSQSLQQRAAERGVARVVAGPLTRRLLQETRGGAERHLGYFTARSSGQRHPSAAALPPCCVMARSVLAQQLPLGDGIWRAVRHWLSGHYRTDPARPLPSTRRLLWLRRRVSPSSAVSTPACCHGRNSRAPRTSSSAANYLSDPNLLSATSTLEMGINIGDSLHRLLLASVPPSRQLPAADRPRPAGRDAMPWFGPSFTAPPTTSTSSRSRSDAARPRQAHRACYLSDAAASWAPVLRLHPGSLGAERHRFAQALPRQLKPPRCVEKAGNAGLQNTFPLHLAAVVPGPFRASCWSAFAALPRPAG